MAHREEFVRKSTPYLLAGLGSVVMAFAPAEGRAAAQAYGNEAMRIAQREIVWSSDADKANCERVKDYLQTQPMNEVVRRNMDSSCPAPIREQIMRDLGKKKNGGPAKPGR